VKERPAISVEDRHATLNRNPLPLAMSSAAADTAADKATARDRCEKYIRSSGRNVTVKFLYDRLTKLGCDPPSDLMRCLDCTGRVGGFGAVEEIQVDSSDRRRDSVKNGEACAQTREEIEGLLAKQNDGEAKLRLVPEIYLCQQHLRDETHAHEVSGREARTRHFNRSMTRHTYCI